MEPWRGFLFSDRLLAFQLKTKSLVMHINQLALFQISGIVNPASLYVTCVTFVQDELLAIFDQSIFRFCEELDRHPALNHNCHIVTRVRVLWFSRTRLPSLQHHFRAIRISRISGSHCKTVRCIGHADMMIPNSAVACITL